MSNSNWTGAAGMTVSTRDGAKGKPYLRLAVQEVQNIDGVQVALTTRTFALNAVPQNPAAIRAMAAALTAYAVRLETGNTGAEHAPAVASHTPAVNGAAPASMPSIG